MLYLSTEPCPSLTRGQSSCWPHSHPARGLDCGVIIKCGCKVTNKNVNGKINSNLFSVFGNNFHFGYKMLTPGILPGAPHFSLSEISLFHSLSRCTRFWVKESAFCICHSRPFWDLFRTFATRHTVRRRRMTQRDYGLWAKRERNAGRNRPARMTVIH